MKKFISFILSGAILALLSFSVLNVTEARAYTAKVNKRFDIIDINIPTGTVWEFSPEGGGIDLLTHSPYEMPAAIESVLEDILVENSLSGFDDVEFQLRVDYAWNSTNTLVPMSDPVAPDWNDYIESLEYMPGQYKSVPWNLQPIKAEGNSITWWPTYPIPDTAVAPSSPSVSTFAGIPTALEIAEAEYAARVAAGRMQNIYPKRSYYKKRITIKVAVIVDGEVIELEQDLGMNQDGVWYVIGMGEVEYERVNESTPLPANPKVTVEIE